MKLLIRRGRTKTLLNRLRTCPSNRQIKHNVELMMRRIFSVVAVFFFCALFDASSAKAFDGCNAYGCWQNGGGCNAYGCWNSPVGSCNAYGCSNTATCNAYGCAENGGGCNADWCWKRPGGRRQAYGGSHHGP